MTFISPHFTAEMFGPNPTLCQKILIFSDREFGWRFDIAKATEKIPDAGYAVISILFAYFEMIAQYSDGVSSKSGPTKAFCGGVRLVYPTSKLTDTQLDTIYSSVRCGMFHNGYTKFGTLISGDFPIALDVNKDTVLVNPHKLLADLCAHFTQYVAMLTDVTKTTERANFEKIFDANTNPTPPKT